MLAEFPYEDELLQASRALRKTEVASLLAPGCKKTKLTEHQARTWHDYLERQVRERALMRATA